LASASRLTDTRPMMSCQNLRHTVSSRFQLHEVSFELHKGRALVLMGPSGAGKSTLLRCLNLLTAFEEGVIELEDGARARAVEGRMAVSIAPSLWRQRVGMVFQDLGLWPNKTVLANIMEGPIAVLRKSVAEARELAAHLAVRVGLEELTDAYPGDLSGGERQRAAIARCLAMRPGILLLDEVTSALDPANVASLLDLIATLKSDDRALIIATHHIAFAREVGDEIIFMDNGCTVSKGPLPGAIDRPDSPQFSSFLNALARAR
jgi:polar amino acid transport system ATP-binding protein